MKYQLEKNLDPKDAILFALERVLAFKIKAASYDPATGELEVIEKTLAERRASVSASDYSLLEKRIAALETSAAKGAVIEKELTDEDSDPATPGLLTKIKEFFGGGKV